jgi:hypothetical protein
MVSSNRRGDEDMDPTILITLLVLLVTSAATTSLLAR